MVTLDEFNGEEKTCRSCKEVFRGGWALHIQASSGEESVAFESICTKCIAKALDTLVMKYAKEQGNE